VTETIDARRCLNCGAPLQGMFCAACGQRAVPPHPTVRELAGDAWQEMTGYDGRIMSTIRGLLRPGFLTREYLDGRRVHYLPPLRVYLIVSVVYFLVAAAAPELDSDRSAHNMTGPGGLRISVDKSEDGAPMTEEERAEMRAEIESASWIFRPMLVAMQDDPDGFRARMFAISPRVFFVLLPVFAGVVALFYRRRTFPTALVFAVHLHAFAFAAFAISEAMKFTGNEHLADRVTVVITLLFSVYALKAFRAVFGGGWPTTLLKAVGIGFVYLFASLPAFIVLVLWASWM
jgi:hypothetical protein